MNLLLRYIKIKLALCLPVFFSFSLSAQVTAQIGAGNDVPVNGTQYSPLFRFTAASVTTNSRSDILFTQDELSAAGIPAGATILAVQFNKLNGNNFLIPTNFQMLMKNSSSTALNPSAITWADILNTFTPVYSNSAFNLPASAGWVTWNLQTPFVYSGGSLEIATENTMTGGSTGASGNIPWEWTAGTPISTIVGATNLAAFTAGQAPYRSRPNIKIIYYPPQTTVQIGLGNNVPQNGTQYSPIYRFSAASVTTNSRSDILFTQSELAAAGIPAGSTITGVQFNKLTGSYFLIPSNFNMLMGNTSNTALDPGAISWASISGAFTTVYSNSAFNVPSTAGWVKWDLQTPFVYTGGALEIATDNTMTGGPTGATGNFSWEWTSSTPVSMAVGALNLGAFTTGQAPYRARPNIKISYYPPACVTPSTPVVSKITNTTATIDWGAVSGASGYQYAITTSATPPAAGTDVNTNTINESGLNPLTQYYVHVRTRCGSGYSLFWATTSFNTLEHCPKPSKPEVVTSKTSNTAIIKWHPSPFGASGYEYTVSTNSNPPASGLVTTDTSISATGLIGATKYYIHVRANCNAQGNSSWVTTEFTTPCFTPAPAATLSTKGSDINISWTSTAGSRNYEYAVTGSTSNPASGTTISDTVYNVSGLNGGSTYYFHVRSYCGTSVSDWARVPINLLGLEVYPNPVKGDLQIVIHGLNNAGGQIVIGDALGRIVSRLQLNGSKGSVNTTSWAPGIYLVRYDDGKNSFTVRVMKR